MSLNAPDHAFYILLEYPQKGSLVAPAEGTEGRGKEGEAEEKYDPREAPSRIYS